MTTYDDLVEQAFRELERLRVENVRLIALLRECRDVLAVLVARVGPGE
jgi:hypothetical protein